MITHVRVFAEFHGDNTHVYTNVREVFTLKAPDNVLNIRNSESGVSVCGLFFFVRISVHICGSERERLTDSNGKVRSRKSAKLAVLATTPEEVLDCPLCSCRLERKVCPPPLSLSLHSCT